MTQPSKSVMQKLHEPNPILIPTNPYKHYEYMESGVYDRDRLSSKELTYCSTFL